LRFRTLKLTGRFREFASIAGMAAKGRISDRQVSLKLPGSWWAVSCLSGWGGKNEGSCRSVAKCAGLLATQSQTLWVCRATPESGQSAIFSSHDDFGGRLALGQMSADA
jgi:hypothetical protein